MREQIISLETAKLLRAMDNKLPMTHYYVLNFMNFKEDGVAKDSEGICKGNSKGQPHLARACTQTILQRWLRETHNIHIEITTDNFNGWGVCLNVKDDNENTGYWTYGHQSYEGALENGLTRALDLIKP